MKSASILQLSILPGQANYRTHSANVLLTIHFTEMQTDGLRSVSAGSEFFFSVPKVAVLAFYDFSYCQLSGTGSTWASQYLSNH